MREQIQKALDSPVGMALWSSGRAADLEWFQFGQRRTVTARNGTKEVGEYALHIQCGWRIRCGDQVVVGGRDLYYPPEGSDGPMDDFDWNVQGATGETSALRSYSRTRRDSSWYGKLRPPKPEVSQLFSTMSMLWTFFLTTL